MLKLDWGGLCESLKESEGAEIALTNISARLLPLEQAKTLEEVIAVFKTGALGAQAKIAVSDVHYLNSPLLDGIWQALTREKITQKTKEFKYVKGNVLESDYNVAQFFLDRSFVKKSYIRAFEDKPEYLLNNALLWACSYGHDKTAKLLLDNGADIHTKNDDSIIRASRDGHLNVVKLLLSRGVNVHISINSALGWASNNGHFAVVSLLLDKGANSFDGPLKNASENGHFSVVSPLLDKGADIHSDHDYALRMACKYGHVAVVTLLLDKGANVHANDEQALLWACERGHSDTVKILLDRGADIHAGMDLSMRRACYFGHIEVAKILMDRGAYVHTWYGYLLSMANEKGQREMVHFLLDQWARVHNDLALKWACEYNRADIVKLLLARGAIVPAEHTDKVATLLFGNSKTVHTDDGHILSLALDEPNGVYKIVSISQAR